MFVEEARAVTRDASEKPRIANCCSLRPKATAKNVRLSWTSGSAENLLQVSERSFKQAEIADANRWEIRQAHGASMTRS